MKMIILGDTHFGARSDAVEFHRYFEKFYTEILFPFMKKNKINTIFQMGDLFDRRKFINFNTLHLCRNYFFEKLKENKIIMHTLLGNHDIAFKNTLEVNSPELVLREYQNVVIYNEFTTVNFDGTDIDIIPWICDENEEDIIKSIRTSKSQICFGHLEIDGFEMDRGNVHKGGLDRIALKKYDIVLSGHFHHKSTSDNITYVGTPYEMTWMDFADKKGFHVLDTNTREMTFHENPFVMFKKVFYNDKEQDAEYWKKFDYSELKESYIKVVVSEKVNPFLFDTVIDQINKAEVCDLTIIEDTSIELIEDDQELIDQAEDTITILNGYIDNLALDIDSSKLKNVMREVYVEALNIEKNS
jgi:hypothetical protein